MVTSFSAWFGLVAAVLVSLSALPARADEMDLALERLVTGGDDNCALTLRQPPVLRDAAENPLLGPHDAHWAALMSELSAATQPSLMQPVTTSGPTGIDAMLIQSVTGIRADARYWEKGSRGRGRGSQRDCSGVNRGVRGALSRTQLRVIKSLPFGISMGSTIGKLWQTSLWTFGGEVKVALVEGYRRIAVPDIAVRVAANTVVGDRQYTLTNLTVSAIVSKPFVVAQIMRMTPYVAYQAGVGFARSSLIDLTPRTDAFALCDDPPPTETGTLTCDGGDSSDLVYDKPFESLVTLRHQLGLGMVLRYHYATLTMEFLLDMVPTAQSTPRVPDQVLRQWTVGISPGVSF